MASRELATYALALGAHALVVAWAWTPARAIRSAPAVVIVAAHEAEVEIEIEIETASETARAESPPEAVAMHVPAAMTTRTIERAVSPIAAPAASAPRAPEALAGSNGTFIVFAPSTGIGGGGQINPFLARGALGEQDAGAPAGGTGTGATEGKRSDGTLAAALRARDVAKGLGPEGPVIRALEQATLASAAPIKGGATFKAIVDAAGLVTDLRLVAWRGERLGWDDTRERAVIALAAKKLELRGAAGAELSIHVESDLRLPSGTGTSDLSQKRTVLSLDPSDVGARPTRVVHAHLESFKLL